MCPANQKSEEELLPKRLLLISLIFFVFFIFCVTSSCNRSDADAFHPEYFGPVLNKFDSLADNTDKPDINLLMDAYDRFSHPGKGDLAEKYNRLAEYYFTKENNISLALDYADSTIRIIKPKTKNSRLTDLLSEAHFRKGAFLYRMGQQAEAITNYSHGKYLLSRVYGEDNCRLGLYYEGLANFFFAKQNFAKALENYRMHLDIASKCLSGFKQFVYIQGNLDNMAICYTDLKLYDSATIYYNKALEYIEQNAHRFPANTKFVTEAKLVIYKNIATTAIYLQDFKKSKQYILMGIEAAKQYQDLTIEFKLLLLWHYIYFNQEAENTTQLFKELDALLIPTGDDNSAASYYYMKAYYHAQKKDTGKAYIAHEKLMQVKDSITSRGNYLTKLDLEREFEYKKQKLMNESLQKDVKIKRVYIGATAAIAAMIAAIVVLISISLRKSNRHVKEFRRLHQLSEQQNEELHDTLLSLEQSHEENNKMVRMIAHDLKNPISGVRMISHALLRNEPDKSRKEMIAVVETTCYNSLIMIDDLISEKKKLKDIKKELVDMANLLQYSVNLLQAKAKEKQQKLLLDVEPVTLLVNRQKIWRVISNIVTNAIKFSPQKSAISIKLKNIENGALVTVSDKGIGIPAELQDKIFSFDGSVSRLGTSGEESYGLGLSISKKIVEEHSGKLWFTSEPDKGSIFYIELPRLN